MRVKSLRSTNWSSLTYDLLIWTDDCNLWYQSSRGNSQYFCCNCWRIYCTDIGEVVHSILHRADVCCVVWWCPWHQEPGFIVTLYWSGEFHVGGSSRRIGEVLGERGRGVRGVRNWEVKNVRRRRNKDGEEGRKWDRKLDWGGRWIDGMKEWRNEGISEKEMGVMREWENM